MTTKPDTGTYRVVLTGLLVCIVLLGFGLRLHGLDSSSLWLDELFTAAAARLDLMSLLRFHLTEAANPFLTSVVTHVAFANWGTSEVMARLPFVLFGSLSILLLHGVGEALWTRKVAMTAAFLMAVNAFHVEYSREARYYALMVFLALLSLIFLVKALRRDSRGLWLGYVVCTTLSLYNHYFAFLFLPAEVIYGGTVIAERWFAERSGAGQSRAPHQFGEPPSAARQAVRFTTSLLLVGISYLPWISTLQAQFPKQLQSPGLGITMASLRFSVNFSHTSLIAQSGATGALLAFWIVLLLWGMWTSGRKQMLLAAVWLLTPLLFLAAVQPRHPVQERYMIYTLPLLLLVASRGLISLSSLFNRVLGRVLRDRKLHPIGTQVLTVLVLAGLSAAPFRGYPTWDKGDWRSAAAYLRHNMRTGDLIIVDGYGHGPGADAGAALNGLTYYLSFAGESASMFAAEGGLARTLADETDQSATVWGVLWHKYDLADVEQVDPDFEVIEFPKVAVIRPLAPQGDLLEDTLSLLETLVLLQPRPSGRIDLHLALAETYAATGETGDARYHLELAEAAASDRQSAAGPDSVKASFYRRLGEAHLQMGNIDEALSAYEQALKIEPDHPRAQRGLDLLSRACDADVPSPLFRNLGFQMALLGYGLDSTTASPSTTVDLSLWWLALAPMDRDYTAFIHLIDEEGRLWAQEDRLLEGRGRYTSMWEVAQLTREEYHLELPPDAPPGRYTLRAGVYHWETGERLAVWDESGQRILGDTMILDHIRITR